MGLMLILTSYPSRSNALTPVSMTAVRSFIGAQSMSRAAAKPPTATPKKKPRHKAGPDEKDSARGREKSLVLVR
jgi:hypothetical protein